MTFAILPCAQARDVAPAPTIDIPRIHEPLTLDEIQRGTDAGRAAVVSEFIQRDPREGVPASQETTAYLAYDAQNLYVGFLCLDAEPGKIRAHVTRRDAIRGDDHVSVLIDTYNDHRRAFSFSVNPLGIQSDSLYTENRGHDSSFDTQWHSRGRLTPDGYVVLLSIPFKSLRFSPEQRQTWGIMLARSIPRYDEYSTWPLFSRSINGRLIQEGEVNGLQNLSPGKNIQLIPYGFFASRRYLDPDTGRFRREKLKDRLGLDAKWVFGTNMALDATLNPDFSQIESDQPQITVNRRFEVFFPEKRPFFLENSNFFQTPISVVFTRRIADPQYGVRLTGKMGRTTVAALAADDRSPGEIVPAGDPAFGRRAVFNIFRINRDIHRESSVGFIWSDREFFNSHNRVFGADGRWKISPTTGMDFQALESYSQNPDTGAVQGRALHASLDHRALHWNGYAGYDERAPNFDVASGFIPRVDIRAFRGRVGYTFRPQSHWIVAWQPFLRGDLVLDHRNTRQDLVGVPGLWVQFARNTHASAHYVYKRERYENLDFLKRRYSLDLYTRRSAWFSLGMSYDWGQQINYDPADGANPFLGQNNEISFHLTVQPSSRLAVENTVLESRLLTLDQTQNVFNNNILRSKWTYQFTPRLSLRMIGQYTNVLPTSELTSLERSKDLSGDFLITYLVHPGTAFYVGYNNLLENYNRDLLAQSDTLARTRADLLSTAGSFFVKFSYLYQF